MLERWVFRILAIFLLSLTSFLTADLSEEAAIRRIFAFLKIKSPHNAVIEAESALEKFPRSASIHSALISALAADGKEIEALKLLRDNQPPKEWMSKRRELTEIAWAILSKGNSSDQLLVRIMSLIGSSLTRDVRAVPFLLTHLQSSNAALRFLALRFAPLYKDKILCEAISELLMKEQVIPVKCEAIRTIGRMEMLEENNALEEIIASSKALPEEKVAAMEALLMLSEEVEEKELIPLFHSNRSGLRQLGCEIVAYFGLKEKKAMVSELLKDSSSQVRLTALHALGMLGEAPEVGSLFDDPCPEVSITAAWAALRMGIKGGEEIIEKWCEGSNSDLRHYAAAVLSKVGVAGTSLSLRILKKSTDPYVRVNLALGLIGYRVETALACEEIAHFLVTEKNLLMWDQKINSHISAIHPSTVRHIEMIPRYPQLVDDFVRLDLLSTLAMMRYPNVDEVLKEFLKHEMWGVSFTAGELLLTEGEGEMMDVIRGLLQSQDESLRLQAAILLTAMAGDGGAFKVLKEAYSKSNRDRKIAILEALAQSGSKESLPFLIEILGDSFQVLRILSASALIQCLQS